MMQKKKGGTARSFVLKGLLLLAAIALCTGFFAYKTAVESGGADVPQVTLTFDAGEGSFKEGKTLNLTGKAGENLALPEAPVRDGYTLTGWNPALPEKYPEKNTEYTAVWVREGDFIITYANVDGVTNENPPSYNVETGTITLEDPVKPGYTFGGWYKTEDFTGKLTEITQGSTGNITLYAKWKQIPFTTVKVDGGNCTLNGKEVTLSSFWISPYEVTQEEFESLMTGNTNGIKPKPSEFYYKLAEGEVQERRPVEQVSWYDAIVYCNLLSIKEGLTPCYTIKIFPDPVAGSGEKQDQKKAESYPIKSSTDPADWGFPPLSNNSIWDGVTCNFNADGYRLPTEAEWEYAARGGQSGIKDGSWNYKYSGSNRIDDVAWYDKNSGRKTHEVGKKKANALGIYDMSGNVYEWCWDRYDNNSYPSGTENPAGPEPDSYRVYRVLRGGSLFFDASSCSVSDRQFNNPCFRIYNYGFRLVRSAR